MSARRELADALGISRGSVREALRRLTGDGLVVFEVNRGFFVADVGLERVLERLEARLLLEPGDRATRRGAARRRRPGRAAAQRSSQSGRRATAAAAHDASRAFHAALVASARNDALTRIFDALWIADVGQRLLASRRSQPDWQEADVAEHEELLAAVEDGDGGLAESLMRAHVESAWRHWARRPTPAGADG